MRLERLRALASAGSRPRRRHLLGDHRAKVLLDRNFVHRPVLAGGAVDGTNHTAIRAHFAPRLANRSKVAIVRRHRGIDLSADVHLRRDRRRYQRPTGCDGVNIGRRTLLRIGAGPHRIDRRRHLACHHRLPRAARNTIDRQTAGITDDGRLPVVEVHQPNAQHRVGRNGAGNRARVVMIEDLRGAPALVHGVAVRTPLAEAVPVAVAMTIDRDGSVDGGRSG